MQQLLHEAELLAGRPVEVAQTTDGKYIVLYMSLDTPPPPKADTPEEALKGFITYMKGATDGRVLPVV